MHFEGAEVVGTGVGPAVAVTIVVGRGVDGIIGVGLAVDAGNAAVITSGQKDSIGLHFPSSSSYVSPGHSHLSETSVFVKKMIPITLVGILPCTGAFHIRDQDNNKYHCMYCHIYSIAYHRDTNFHIKGLSKNFEFAFKKLPIKTVPYKNDKKSLLSQQY